MQNHSQKEIDEATGIFLEYEKSGAVKQTPPGDGAVHSLVRAVQTRRGGGEIQVNLRLQRTEQIFLHKKVSFGPLTQHFSLFEKRKLGSQNRSEGRLFSFTLAPHSEALLAFEGRRKSLGVSGRLLWSERYAPIVYDGDENIRTEAEKTGYNVLH